MTVSSAFRISIRTESFCFSRRRICMEGCGPAPPGSLLKTANQFEACRCGLESTSAVAWLDISAGNPRASLWANGCFNVQPGTAESVSLLRPRDHRIGYHERTHPYIEQGERDRSRGLHLPVCVRGDRTGRLRMGTASDGRLQRTGLRSV